MVEIPGTVAPLELISATIALVGIGFDSWGAWDAWGDRLSLQILRRLLNEWELKRRKAQARANITHRLTHLSYQLAFLVASVAAMTLPNPARSNEPGTIAATIIFLCIIGIELGLMAESIADRFGRWRIHGIIRETRQGDPPVSTE